MLVITGREVRSLLGQVLIGEAKGRRAPNEVTIFESLGLGVEDVAAAHYVYEQAVERGAGMSVELGGLPSAPSAPPREPHPFPSSG